MAHTSWEFCLGARASVMGSSAQVKRPEALIGHVCLDSYPTAKAVTGTDMAMCLGIILGNEVWQVNCKNGCNSLPLPISMPFAVFLLSKVGVYCPSFKSGLAFWFALPNWVRWEFISASRPDLERPEPWCSISWDNALCTSGRLREHMKQSWSIPTGAILDHSTPSWPTTWLKHNQARWDQPSLTQAIIISTTQPNCM